MIYVFVMLPIITGLLLYILDRFISKSLAVAVQGLLFMLSIYVIFLTRQSDITMPLVNVPLPYGMVLKADSLSALMLLLSNFLFGTMVIFSYKKDYMNRLFLFLFLSLQGLINGLFLSYDLFNVYILIEVATITVSILIMFKKDSQSMYDGMIYLTVNMIAMGFFLFGVAFLYKLFGVLDFESLTFAIADLEDTKQLYVPFSFLLTGVGLKAAIMPLFSWLPKAHGTASAPSIVSAILSGIFVKVGIYLVIRMLAIFSSAIDIQSLILILGFMTALSGFIFAVSQHDIKLILAYHTISQVGLILIGISGPFAYNQLGGVYHIISHGVFKSLFFIISGILTHHFKTRKIHNMSGLWQSSKFLSLVLMVAIFSITGAPFFSGGFSKYFISYGYAGMAFALIFFVINVGTMTSFVKFFMLIFTPNPAPKPIRLSANESGVLATFVIVCFLLGFAGESMVKLLFNQPITYSPFSQLSKLPAYLVTYLACFMFYHYALKRSKILAYIKTVELTFNSINIAMVFFFLFTLTFLNYL